MSSDLWHWRVTYLDGSTLDEYDADGKDHGWAEVERRAVIAVDLLPQSPAVLPHRVTITGGHYPVFWRRRRIGVNQDGTEGTRSTVHILGLEWEPGDGIFLFLFEDGSTLLADDFNAV